jgi:hypothetical protein
MVVRAVAREVTVPGSTPDYSRNSKTATVHAPLRYPRKLKIATFHMSGITGNQNTFQVPLPGTLQRSMHPLLTFATTSLYSTQMDKRERQHFFFSVSVELVNRSWEELEWQTKRAIETPATGRRARRGISRC